MTDESTAVQQEWEYGSGVDSDFLTTEDKEALVESATTLQLIDVIEASSKFGPMLTYTLVDGNDTEMKMSLSIKDNKARVNQGRAFKAKIVTLSEGEGIPVRLIKKGRAFDFAPPLADGIPF